MCDFAENIADKGWKVCKDPLQMGIAGLVPLVISYLRFIFV